MYSYSRAPAIVLPLAAYRAATQAQNAAPYCGTYGEERQVAQLALTAAGVAPEVRAAAIAAADSYFMGELGKRHDPVVARSDTREPTKLLSTDEQIRGVLIAARMTVGLLVSGAYDVVETMTAGRHLSADELRRAAETLGEPLVRPPESEWSRLSITPLPEREPPEFDVVVPLWTAEGRSELGLKLRVLETTYQTSEVEIHGFCPVGPNLPPAAWDTEPPPETTIDQKRPAVSVPSTNSPVPDEWRSTLTSIVHRLVIGDYAGLAADGLVHRTTDPADTSIGMWIEEYPATLVDLPADAWPYSDHGPLVGTPGAWWVIVPLWTAEEGLSDLSMEATVWDDGTDLVVKIDEVHVM